MHLDHVSEIDTRSELLVYVFLSWAKLSILSSFQMEFDKFVFQPLKNLIVFKSIGGKGALFQLETDRALN